jgi:hypothetical protein
MVSVEKIEGRLKLRAAFITLQKFNEVDVFAHMV